MLRAFLLSILLPAALLAQAPAPAPKTAAPAPKPAPAPAPRSAPASPPAAPRATTPVKAPAPAAAAPMTDEEKTVYALGLLVQRSLRQFDLTAGELEILKRALSDAAAGKPSVVLTEWGPRIEPLGRARATRVAAREKGAAAAYVATAAAQTGAVQSASGLVYREVAPGTGESPKASDTVKVHYRGTLTDGTEFDSSYARNEPASFRLEGVIPCWTEGLQKMKVGGKARLVCPSNLAYGDEGNQAIPGGAALVFEIELLEIVAAPAPQPAN
jgi:FKBP-type peptidyl-prolyl cis-trans isomerase FkpA